MGKARPPSAPPAHYPALACTFLIMGACSDYGLSQQWQLDRLRLLGIRAEPAEPQPGELVHFSSLIYLPKGAALEGAIWFACLPEEADTFGCVADTALLEEAESADPSTMSSEELAALYEELVEAGFIGFEPLFPPTWTAPADALEGLSEEEAQEGVSALVNISVIPTGAEDENDIEIAYKRVPISRSTTPNHNPTLLGLRVARRAKGGEEVDVLNIANEEEVYIAEAGRQYQIDPIFSPDSIEAYVFVDESGGIEERSEEPYFSWYTEGGAFDQPFSLYGSSGVVWTAPSQAFSGMVLLLMRDRRGGMAWRKLQVEVAG